MLLTRIREKTADKVQTKVTRPQSAGLKYLNKVAAKVVTPQENVDPPRRYFPPGEDYETMEKFIDCNLDRRDERITPA